MKVACGVINYLPATAEITLHSPRRRSHPRRKAAAGCSALTSEWCRDCGVLDWGPCLAALALAALPLAALARAPSLALALRDCGLVFALAFRDCGLVHRRGLVRGRIAVKKFGPWNAGKVKTLRVGRQNMQFLKI